MSYRRGGGLEAEREEFIKSQILAMQKALNKQEMALKQKHARTLILGTHKEKAANMFWNQAQRLQLEKHPIVSWKFCHLLHKLIRDGHARVLTDSMRFRSRLDNLGMFWQHLQGYGKLINRYCVLLSNRLSFHQRNDGIPGSLQLSDSQLAGLGGGDVNNAFELAVEMLDQMDDLLALQRDVFNSLDIARSTSLTFAGQCRLSPLILVILDSSKFYDYLVKVLFKLHASLPPDVLAGHRDRFNAQFKVVKQFYYQSSNLQYFKYLVSIPPIPENPPNFLQASDFESYVTPHAYLHGDGISEGSDSPVDGQSMADFLVDVSEPPPPTAATPTTSSDQFDEAFGGKAPFQNGVDEKNQIIDTLKRDVEDARAFIERLKVEARSRMEQYESRLLQMDHEASANKGLVDQLTEENDRFRGQAEQLQNEKNQQTAARLEETEKKAVTNEEKFKKMKDVYAKLREEHIEVLKKLGNVQKDFETSQGATMDTQDKLRTLERELDSLRRERSLVEEKAQNKSATIDDLNGQLVKMQMEIEQITREKEEGLEVLQKEKSALQANLDTTSRQVVELNERFTACQKRLNDLFSALCIAAVKLTEDTVEQFDNPAHLSVTCSPEFMLTRTGPLLESYERLRDAFQSAQQQQQQHQQQQQQQEPDPGLCQVVACFAHELAEAVLHGKATANAAPTNQTESSAWSAVPNQLTDLKSNLDKFHDQYRSLLGKMGDVDLNEIGSQMDKEMKRMDAAIQQAAAKIQEILSKSRETDTGVRLEVNEKILDSCNALMQAIMVLVARSRDMQNEIVAAGRGTGSVTDFYKRHHQWSEGLLSAAKAVGGAANILVHAADSVITGQGKFEELIVASQEIAASVAQLVVSSRVKADKNSQSYTKLATASKTVSSATAKVVGTVKSGQETLTSDQALDFSHIGLHQTKRMEMDSQVRVLELEAELTKERARLGTLRKQHYHLAGSTVEDDGSSGNSNNSPSKEATPS